MHRAAEVVLLVRYFAHATRFAVRYTVYDFRLLLLFLAGLS